MTLTLQIENFHVLDDGGPVSIRVPETGIQVGRRSGMDWVLPDASRYISGHHFDVSFDGTRWWLRDLSTNGTFLQGHHHRLNGPHALTNGDRFEVGHYIIVAVFDVPEDAGAIDPASLPQHHVARPVHEDVSGDPWAIGGPVEPIDVALVSVARRGPEFANDFVAFSDPVLSELGLDHVLAPQPVQPPMVPDADPGASPFGPPDAALPAAAPPVPKPPARKTKAAAVVSDAPVTPIDQAGFVRGFCRGAGLPDDVAANLDPEQFGQTLGEAMRAAATQIMAALHDRSAARHFTRSGERTMRGATDNNPLKFLPNPEQAIEALFLKPRAGFLTGAAGLDEALDDLRRHQAAVFAALQPALIDLLKDLDPDSIEAEIKGGGPLGGNRKARAWDGFVARWDAKTASENGILDEFLRLFAAAYRRADEPDRPS